MSVREIKARGIVRGQASGPALVSKVALSFLGDLDIGSGEVVAHGSNLRGQSLAGKVIVMPVSIGSAGSWRFLYQLFVHKTHPLAIVCVKLVEPSLVQGAILAKVPIVCEPEADVISEIHDGDIVDVDGDTGLLRVHSQR
jgi:predicted aconitase with swiveling domain